MVVDFSTIDFNDHPILILKKSNGSVIGVLGCTTNISADLKYNETSVLEFNIPSVVDGINTPYYDSVVGMRIIELQGIGQFILVNPKEVDDGISTIKSCKAYSLEYEFTFKKISLENSTYNFWNPVVPEDTILQIILDLMPSWSVGDIDDELIGKYRTFEISDENLYNFIKGTVQESYNCIFDFDTMTRRINVKSAASTVPVNPVYISNDNLAEEITVEEQTEDIVTRLDVNGADGVTIRDVNPSGTNQIINLDYFMTNDNFDQDIIEKYQSWKNTYNGYQQQYYNLSVEYSLQVMRQTTEHAALTELEAEMTSLENQQAVIIRAIANHVDQQSSLDEINEEIDEKNTEISNKKREIDNIKNDVANIYSRLKDINTATKFESFFDDDEYLQIDRYLKDDSVSESSFVVQEADSYTDSDTGSNVTNLTISISDSTISKSQDSRGGYIYDIKGGVLNSDFVDAEIISAAFEQASDNTFVMTAYIGAGTTENIEFPKGCVSITGSVSSVTHNLTTDDIRNIQTGSSLLFVVETGFLYFTRNTSEYEKRSVAWDLFKYGNDILQKISQPSYTFSVKSSNFLALEDFIGFKNSIHNGEKIYVGISDTKTLTPICIGIKFEFDSIESVELEFSDKYVSGDSSFLLADLLDRSISMGKNVDLSKYTYSAFMDSGASTKVKDFMTTALDVSKNAIMSSREQAIYWGDSGFRMRQWADDLHTTYDPKQLWLNNNSILMTSNNWATAEIAIGNFYDENLGDCWGVVAPNIVGTLLAGRNLVIESEKKDGSVAVFKVDAEGCFLHNSDFSVTSDTTDTHILINPKHGFIIGKYPLFDADGNINDDNKRFYADTEGNLTLKGTIFATSGEFTGRITATSGYIGDGVNGWTILDSAIYNGRDEFSDITTDGTYIGTDGISLGSGLHYIMASSSGAFRANNVFISGNINATSGTIGGCEIIDGVLKVGNANITSISASKITTGTLSANMISGGTIDASDVTITNLNASNIKYGTLDGDYITVRNLSANSITTGTISADNIAGLPASKIVEGVLSSNRIPDLSAYKITSGTLDSLDISGCRIFGTAISVGGTTPLASAFGVTSTGDVSFGSSSSDGDVYVYGYGGSGSGGSPWTGRHTCPTFEMTLVRDVDVAIITNKITLYFIKGFCVGWRNYS